MITSETIKNFVESNSKWIKRKETSIPGVYVLKYNNKCFYKNHWNEYLENCRGVVVNQKYDIISNPFQKIFNYGIESHAPRISGSEYVSAIRKVNGFMLAVSVYNGELIYSTTGSIDSDYVKMGKEMFEKTSDIDYFRWACQQSKSTAMFEIVHKEDPHIIKEKEGVYFLGSRKNEWGSKLNMYSDFEDKEYCFKGITYPERLFLKMDDLKQKVKNVKHEGYVIYCKDGRTTKIKSKYYLISKFFSRCNNTDKLFDRTAKSKYDEEFYPLIEKIHEDKDNFAFLSEQDRLEYIRNYLENL